MLVKLVQPKNAPPFISVTLSGITMFVRPVQPLNASLPISLTPSGITMLVWPTQPSNALSSIIEIPSGIIEDLQPNMSFLKSFDKQQLFIETYEGLSADTNIFSRLGQFENAKSPISVMPSGITTPVRPAQFSKAEKHMQIVPFRI